MGSDALHVDLHQKVDPRARWVPLSTGLVVGQIVGLYYNRPMLRVSSLDRPDDRRVGGIQRGGIVQQRSARIVRLSTSIIGRYPNLVFVEIETDDGLVGLGETFFG